MNRFILIFSFGLLFGSCTISVDTITKKKEISSQETELSKYANNYFWDRFHQGNYQNIDSILYYLTASYNENPNHHETVTHLGFANIWALSERQKLNPIPPTIIEHGTSALKYFGESYKMNPHDPWVLGFLADLKMTVGNISNDKKLTTQGYFDGKKSIKQWSEFNYFTIGYVLSQLEHTSPQFKKGLEWQWKTLDDCYCEKFDRENPDIKQYLLMEKEEENIKRKRACWNSWIAPHNVEGFYLNMGDMLVKSGDWKKGIEVYKLAQQIPEYNSWPFKALLEHRIENAEINVEKFRRTIENGENVKDEDVMLISSSISCMACHQMSPKDQQQYKGFDWKAYQKKMKVYNP